MFGYVKAYPNELLVKEYEFYRATYCGICRSMKKHTGILSNVLHSYDSVFMALVRMLYIDERGIKAGKRRCIAHPLKSRVMLKDNPAIEYTAKAFATLTYFKLIDDIMDEKLIKKITVSALRPVFSHAKRRSGLRELAEVMASKLAEINRLEKEGCPSADRVANLFGELLGEVFAAGLSGNDKLVCYEVGRHLGRFIYLADAADDYEKDRKSGSYNPYVILYESKPLTDENKSTIKCGLLLECRALEGAVNLLPFGNLVTIESILKNIIYLGLPKRIEFLDPKEQKELSAENIPTEKEEKL